MCTLDLSNSLTLGRYSTQLLPGTRVWMRDFNLAGEMLPPSTQQSGAQRQGSGECRGDTAWQPHPAVATPAPKI